MKKQEKIDIIVTAVEGGSDYWGRFDRYDPDRGTVRVTVHEEDAPKYNGIFDITTATVDKGLQLIKKLQPKSWARLVNEDWDAWDADECIQLGLFGELVFG